MNQLSLYRFEQLVGERTGIRVSDRERKGLQELVVRRMARLRLGSVDEYLELLELDTSSSRHEWDELALSITNNESYFFRDQGQMALLRRTLLPELIGRAAFRRSIRIWSAGSSTGEEPYSLAIMMAELLPERAGWNIDIIGSDISAGAIEKARAGVYGAWSFRMVDPAVRARYFRQRDDNWTIDPAIRSMVTFRQGNLARESAGCDAVVWGKFDLILCRNVFIYFGREAIRSAVAMFADLLADGGYLLTGHGELGPGDLAGLRTRHFAESVVYQRSASPAIETGAHGGRAPASPFDLPPIIPPAPLPAVPPPIRSSGPSVSAPQKAASPPVVPLEEIEALIAAGSHAAAIAMGERALRDDPRNARLLALMGMAYADRGEYDAAIRRCDDALKIDPLLTDPYFILAHIAEDRGEKSVAKKHYNAILYIAPGSVAAYLHLADIHAGEGDGRRAAGLRGQAMHLLAALPAGAHVRHYGEATAGEILAYLQRA